MGKYNDPEYWKDLAAYEERPTQSNYVDSCECKAEPTIMELEKELTQNLLEMKDIIDSISKYIFATVATENEELTSNGTIDSLYGILLFDREVCKHLVKCLKIIRDRLGYGI